MAGGKAKAPTSPGAEMKFRWGQLGGGAFNYSLAIALPVSPSFCSKQITPTPPLGNWRAFYCHKKSPTVATRLGGALSGRIYAWV